jgi:hypothetical protein
MQISELTAPFAWSFCVAMTAPPAARARVSGWLVWVATVQWGVVNPLPSILFRTQRCRAQSCLDYWVIELTRLAGNDCAVLQICDWILRGKKRQNKIVLLAFWSRQLEEHNGVWIKSISCLVMELFLEPVYFVCTKCPFCRHPITSFWEFLITITHYIIINSSPPRN